MYMSIKPGILLKCSLLLAGGSLLLSVATYFLFPKVIYEIYGKEVPQKWSMDLVDMDFAQIYQKLGPPQEDVSSKDYQNWLESYWWGVKMLKITSFNCCRSNAQPDAVIYIVYVNGWYDPAYQKVVGRNTELDMRK
jgi:hypothetical protein